MNLNDHPYNLESNSRAAYLIAHFLKKDLTIEEKEELDQWILASEINMQLFEELTEDKAVHDYLKWYAGLNVEASLQQVKDRIDFSPPVKQISLTRWLVAASVILMTGLGIFFYLRQYPASSPQLAQQTSIQPGRMQAVLKMGNGKTVVLDHVSDSLINDQLSIQNGSLIYAEGRENIGMHELSVPVKGFYQVRLPDGTKVWLNSQSWIRYPSSFTGRERRVEVRGETYFEVEKDPSRPFIATAGSMNVQALGTSFNIRAHDDESTLSTTLVEGSVKVYESNHSAIIQPGEQVNVTGNHWQKVKMDDLRPVTAWVRNEFHLKNHSIGEVMNLVRRWYGVDIVYESRPDFHFNGLISRDLPLSELLKLLEETGHVHFRIEGNKVFVRQ